MPRLIRPSRVCFGALTILACLLVSTGAAWAGWGPVGADPPSNYVPGPMPDACNSAPTSTSCVNAAVYYLDQARAGLGQPPYYLPADFPSLSPADQDLILTNLDRVQYGLPPVPGLTDELNGVALTDGVDLDGDPGYYVTDPNILGTTSNWAGGFTNLPLAYEGWMYDDGLGSPNIDCSPYSTGGCWGHRHDILWDFGSNHVLAMGAAAGTDPGGRAGYAMLIAYGDEPGNGLNPGYSPIYTYTWSQAVADGAGTNHYDPGLPEIPVVVKVTVVGPGEVTDSAGDQCSSSCKFELTQGVATKLSAIPQDGGTFSGWSGACHGASCTVTPRGAGTTVTATFAEPDCVVPSLRGKGLVTAERLVADAHCRTGTIARKYSRVRKGRVLAQHPSAGTRLAYHSTVGLVVSRGRRHRHRR